MNEYSIQVQPLSEQCSLPLERKDHVCMGISPFNSLFSEAYIQSLILWADKNFKSFHLFVPDEPAVYTLEALGYSQEESKKKLKKQINWLNNKLDKALSAAGIFSGKENYILNWSTLTSLPEFQEELHQVYEFFDSDEDFRRECLKSSEWVLRGKIENITEGAVLKAVKYFLAEIPLFGAANKIVQKPTSLFCYHQSISFHEMLYTQKLAYQPAFGQGYGVISY